MNRGQGHLCQCCIHLGMLQHEVSKDTKAHKESFSIERSMTSTLLSSVFLCETLCSSCLGGETLKMVLSV